MKFTEEELTEIYSEIKNKPAWLSKCMGNDMFDFSDVKYLELLADEECQWKKLEAQERRKKIDYLKKVDELKKECSAEEKGFVDKCRLEFIETQIEFKKNKIKLVNELFNNCNDFSKRIIIKEAAKYEELLQDLKNLQRELENIKFKDNSKITDYDIERAKLYPIEKIIDVNGKHLALCPFHADSNPSLYCKDNFYFCFSCNAMGSVIDLYMYIHKVDFIQAVKEMI